MALSKTFLLIFHGLAHAASSTEAFTYPFPQQMKRMAKTSGGSCSGAHHERGVFVFSTLGKESQAKEQQEVGSVTTATSKENDEHEQLLHEQEDSFDPNVCSQFKILTCSSTACTKKRAAFGMDEYATFVRLYERKEGAGAFEVELEEVSCLGGCKKAPCVAIEHENYEGYVSLEGMTPEEFGERRFNGVILDNDLDRVWDCVENAIRVMEEDEEEDD